MMEICRVCLKWLDANIPFKYLDMVDQYCQSFRYKLTFCFPEMKLEDNFMKLCEACSVSLEEAYKLKLIVQQTESKLVQLYRCESSAFSYPAQRWPCQQTAASRTYSDCCTPVSTCYYRNDDCSVMDTQPGSVATIDNDSLTEQSRYMRSYPAFSDSASVYSTDFNGRQHRQLSPDIANTPSICITEAVDNLANLDRGGEEAIVADFPCPSDTLDGSNLRSVIDHDDHDLTFLKDQNNHSPPLLEPRLDFSTVSRGLSFLPTVLDNPIFFKKSPDTGKKEDISGASFARVAEPHHLTPDKEAEHRLSLPSTSTSNLQCLLPGVVDVSGSASEQSGNPEIPGRSKDEALPIHGSCISIVGGSSGLVKELHLSRPGNSPQPVQFPSSLREALQRKNLPESSDWFKRVPGQRPGSFDQARETLEACLLTNMPLSPNTSAVDLFRAQVTSGWCPHENRYIEAYEKPPLQRLQGFVTNVGSTPQPNLSQPTSSNISVKGPRKHDRSETDNAAYCEICQRKFASRSSLERHRIVIHNTTRKFICSICLKSFCTQIEMLLHKRDHKNFYYPCPHCLKSFKSNTYRAKHMAKQHMSNGFRCRTCNKIFEDKSKLTSHRMEHTYQVTCRVCKKEFYSKYTLALHMKRHLGRADYCCPVCKKEFFSKHAYDMHMVKHQRKAPYECMICKLKFWRDCDLKAHTTIIHFGKSRGWAAKMPQKTKRRNSCDTPYVCDFCKNGFSTMSALDYHKDLAAANKFQGGGCRPYYCQQCLVNFKSKMEQFEHEFEHFDDTDFDDNLGSSQALKICEVCQLSLEEAYNLKVSVSETEDKVAQLYECGLLDSLFPEDPAGALPQVIPDSVEGRIPYQPICSPISSAADYTDGEEMVGYNNLNHILPNIFYFEYGGACDCQLCLQPAHQYEFYPQDQSFAANSFQEFDDAVRMQMQWHRRPEEYEYLDGIASAIDNKGVELLGLDAVVANVDGGNSNENVIDEPGNLKDFLESNCSRERLSPDPRNYGFSPEWSNSTLIQRTEGALGNLQQFVANMKSSFDMETAKSSTTPSQAGLKQRESLEINEKKFSCTSCFRNVFSEETLKCHPSSSGKPMERFHCSYCQKTYKAKIYLQRHLVKDHHHSRFACKSCAKIFDTKQSLTQHRRQHTFHVSCPVCKKYMYSKYTLAVHMKQHPGQLQYYCEICQKKFHSKRALQTHVQCHRNSGPYECKMAFRKDFILNMHLNPVHNEDDSLESPYKCGSCGKCFSAKESLSYHQNLAANGKEGSCNLTTTSCGSPDEDEDDSVVNVSS